MLTVAADGLANRPSTGYGEQIGHALQDLVLGDKDETVQIARAIDEAVKAADLRFPQGIPSNAGKPPSAGPGHKSAWRAAGLVTGHCPSPAGGPWTGIPKVGISDSAITLPTADQAALAALDKIRNARAQPA